MISVAAELAGMHPQTLRIYERRGLVQPARSQGGNRRYSDVDIERLRRIQELAGEGMNLEGIRRVMASRPRSNVSARRTTSCASLAEPWPRPKPNAAPRAATSCRCTKRSVVFRPGFGHEPSKPLG